ncbi:SgcJ/EcaC family oxidoreductase [Kitasatospora paranensis]|uniref:SgcJ/EcaC family oxidoreductase n=1 Tax=Kitasatospora paranensis TaxID=258053 RepID=A0ABW2G596_9ACTN
MNSTDTYRGSAAPTATRPAEEAARAVLAGLYTAWADNDADAFAAHFTEDVTSVAPGSFGEGRTVLRDRMAARFAGPLKGSRVVDEVQSIRRLGEDTVVVVSRGGVVMAGEQGVPADRLLLATWTLTRAGDGWQVAAYHNSPA